MADARARQFNFRLSADEVARLEAVAAHLGLDASNTVRLLVKKEFDSMQMQKFAEQFQLEEKHYDVLAVLNDDQSPVPRPGDDGVADRLNHRGYGARMSWLVRALNVLRDHGYVRRLSDGYVLTTKGLAARQG